MIVVWSTIVLFYALVLVYLSNVWVRIPKPEAIKWNNSLSVAVVVVFRNEEESLPKLVGSFKDLLIEKLSINFIFINDHSEDNSLVVLDDSLNSFPFNFDIISLGSEESGKKAGLQKAVEHSTADLILTTDADCLVAPNWVNQTVAYFDDPSIQMTTGNLAYKRSDFFSKLFELELAAIIGVTGTSIHLEAAGMANAANMCFRRQAFIESNPYELNKYISTGDDVFLLGAIKAEYGALSIGFVKHCLVETEPPKTLNEFINQRWRWASKWKSANKTKDQLPAIGVWLFHLMFVTGFVLSFYLGNYQMALIGFAGKSLSEFIFIKSVYNSQKRDFPLLAFIVLALFYSLYVLFFGITANFISYKWKGRVYGRANR